MNEIQLWDWIEFDTGRYQVVAINTATVELQSAASLELRTVLTSALVSSATVEQRRAALEGIALLGRLTPTERERCERIANILVQSEKEIPSGQALIERARDLLSSDGIVISERQVWRYLAAHRAHGVAGLADRRRQGGSRASPVDPRLGELIDAELTAQGDVSTGTRTRVIRQVCWKAERLGIGLPSRATMFRLIADLDRGRSSFGAATTRRSKALRPDRTFRGVVATRPGELVEIDSTPLDVIAIFPDGSRGRPELTYAIDVATRTICGSGSCGVAFIAGVYTEQDSSGSTGAGWLIGVGGGCNAFVGYTWRLG